MVRWLFALVVIVMVLAPQGGVATADEGMWLPGAIGKRLPLERLRKMGFEMEPSALWSDSKSSLKDAILQVVQLSPDGRAMGFGSASFVSPQGLILTNHHVAFDSLGALSTPEENLIVNGFKAATLKDERHCPNTGVRFTTCFKDVTGRVEEKAGKLLRGARVNAIAAVSAEIVGEAREKGLRNCEVVSMLEGNVHYLVAYETFPDVRLVHAPPQSIGEFGGDIDNWMWPRHTGDFTYLRAYVAPDGKPAEYHEDNVPYQPKQHLKLSAGGYVPGDFAFIMGYPAETHRYRTSYSIDYREKIYFPTTIEQYDQFKDRLVAEGKANPAKALEHASTIKSIANTVKNFQGMIEGLDALGLVNAKRAEEVELLKWIAADEKRKAEFGGQMERLGELYTALMGGRRPNQEFAESVRDIRRKLVQALAAWKGEVLYPDANSTLRFTYGKVGGYSPRDAVKFGHVTTPDGIMQKHNGEKPFDAPENLRKAVTGGEWGRWADSKMGTVPVNFLTDNDITGGNSGSPIMNGRGEMTGLAFDGNYEALTSDFKFRKDITRTINVDIRYVLWCTDKLAGMKRLIDEMEIVGARD